MIDSFINSVKKMSFFMVIIIIIALIFMPLLPWFSAEIGGKTYYSNEGDLLRGRESIEDLQDTLDSYPDSAKESDEFKAAEDMAEASLSIMDNVSGIGFYFWLSLFFLLIIMIGIGVYSLGQKYQLFGHIFFLLSIFILIFSILIVLNHVFLIGNIGTFNDKLDDLGGAAGAIGMGGLFSTEISFSFNYVPLIMGIILLIFSLIFVIKVIPTSIRAMTYSTRQNKMMAYQQQGYGGPGQQQYQPPPQQPPMQPMPPPPAQQPPPVQQQQPSQPQQEPKKKTSDNKFCPYCGTQIQANQKKCPNCGK